MAESLAARSAPIPDTEPLFTLRHLREVVAQVDAAHARALAAREEAHVRELAELVDKLAFAFGAVAVRDDVVQPDASDAVN